MTSKTPNVSVRPAWMPLMEEAVKSYLEWIHANAKGPVIDPTHTAETPARFTRAMAQYVDGYKYDPAAFLTKQFALGNYNEMVQVNSIRIKSLCGHHGAAIEGKAYFAYLPGEYIVGLSKIPRMIRALSMRLQVQEDLTSQIVDIFQDTVKPKGCGVVVRAYHKCMMNRGVEEPMSWTETRALRGQFLDVLETRQEFLSAVAEIKEPVFP